MDAEVEMARIRFDALGLAPGTPVILRLLEFGLFPSRPSLSQSHRRLAHPPRRLPWREE
jgi:hypothetical protein